MTARSLRAVPVERVWGRRALPPGFPRPPGDAPIGEIWFETPEEASLLVKYLFTSERLSIQVHPDDMAARAKGYPRGKDEAWYVIDAEPDAAIGLGLIREVSPEELRAAALAGSIERLLDWKPAKAGDVFYAPAGTIHAIGGGIALIEIQQNLDLTYRLYDYGRPRELHLDEAVAVAHPRRWAPPGPRAEIGPGRESLAAGNAFALERWTAEGRVEEGVVVPMATAGTIDGQPLEIGSVWSIDGGAAVEGGGVDLLVATPA